MVKPLAVAFSALALRLWLIFQFPIIFGGDSMVRLVNRDHVLLSHQLPLLQLLVWSISRLTSGTLAIRLAMALTGVLATVAFYYLAADFAGPRAALLGALLLATNPFVTPISTVPYQEMLLLGTLFAAFHYFFNRRWVPAAIWLAIACLTRFEAWIACPILAAAWFLDGPRTPRRAAAAIAGFGAAPIAWMLFRRGLSPEGSFVLDHSISLARFFRWSYLGAYTIRETPIPVLLLAGVGLTRWRDRRLLLLAVYLCLFAVAILFSAHGDFPDPERYVTTREIHIPVALLTLLAAIGCARFPRAAIPVAALGVALGVWGSIAYTRHETARPEMLLGYELARYLDANVQPGEQVLIVAQAPNLDLYYRKVRETGGRALSSADFLPLDVQRTVIHLTRVQRDQIFAYPKLPAHADWVAVWSDFAPVATPDARLRVQDRTVAIMRKPGTVPSFPNFPNPGQ
jgi:hypothetical protein